MLEVTEMAPAGVVMARAAVARVSVATAPAVAGMEPAGVAMERAAEARAEQADGVVRMAGRGDLGRGGEALAAVRMATVAVVMATVVLVMGMAVRVLAEEGRVWAAAGKATVAAERVWEEVGRDAGVVLKVPEEVRRGVVDAGRVSVEVVMAGLAVVTARAVRGLGSAARALAAVGGMLLAVMAMERVVEVTAEATAQATMARAAVLKVAVGMVLEASGMVVAARARAARARSVAGSAVVGMEARVAVAMRVVVEIGAGGLAVEAMVEGRAAEDSEAVEKEVVMEVVMVEGDMEGVGMAEERAGVAKAVEERALVVGRDSAAAETEAVSDGGSGAVETAALAAMGEGVRLAGLTEEARAAAARVGEVVWAETWVAAAKVEMLEVQVAQVDGEPVVAGVVGPESSLHGKAPPSQSSIHDPPEQ